MIVKTPGSQMVQFLCCDSNSRKEAVPRRILLHPKKSAARLPVPNTSPRLRLWAALFIIVVLAPPVSCSYVPQTHDSRVLRLKGGRDVRHNMAAASPVVVPAKSSHSATVIWLHGLGDSGSGWAPIAQQLSLPHVKWIFPNAGSRPVTINGGTAMPVFINDSFQGSP
jgi:hypothetical protein